jgi:hypothetical protein
MMKKTVLSLTPVSLENDSRTLKMAASFARKGYRSIVLENKPSQRNFEALGIEVLSFTTNKSVEISESKKIYHLKHLLINIVKFVWHGMRHIGLGAINDRISFYLFKKNFKNTYSLENCSIPQADIYILHSYEYVDFALKLPSNSIVIYDAHDFYQELQPTHDYSTLIKEWILPYQKILESKLIHRSNIFTTVSNGLSSKYKDTFFKQPIVIYNAHDDRIEAKPQKDVREFLDLKKNDIILCAVGNKKLGMAFNQVIEAFSQLPDNFHLVFLGNGYEECNYKNSNIHFIPAIPPEEVVPFLKSSDLGIILYFDLTENYKYALPNRFFQLLAAGLPIIFPQQLKEICAFHKKFPFGLSTDISNISSVREAIEELVREKETYKEKVRKFNISVNWKNEEDKVFYLIKNTKIYNH